jgi:hypothetical protein
VWAGSEAVTDARKSVAAFLLHRGQVMKRLKRMYVICIGAIAAAIALVTGALA